jgi:hypothetical protein
MIPRSPTLLLAAVLPQRSIGDDDGDYPTISMQKPHPFPDIR